MTDRSRARQLADEFLAKGEPTGWFEHLYQEAEQGISVIPWADRGPNVNFLDFWRDDPIASAGKSALQVGCGFGDDAEQLALFGFHTTAFDIAESAIRACQRRFPDTRVEYLVADLLNPPSDWFGRFDFVLEMYTVQSLPPDLHPRAIECLASMVAAGGNLLFICRGREEDEPEGLAPWVLTRTTLEQFEGAGLRLISFEDFMDAEDPPTRRFRVLYEKPR